MLQKFAGEGLRTLCLAVRDLDEVFFNDWKHRHHEAALSLDSRDDKLDAIYEEIERDMTLIGELLVLEKEWGIHTAVIGTRKINFLISLFS
jgi:phospholipid-translocating ATPase